MYLSQYNHYHLYLLILKILLNRILILQEVMILIHLRNYLKK